MQFRFVFKHMASSEALADYAENKIRQKVEKLSTKPIEAHVTFMVEGIEHKVHCSIKGGDGFNCEVETECSDMYACIDLLVDKLEVQLKKHKEKLKNHKVARAVTNLAVDEYLDPNDPDNVPLDAEELIKFE